MKRPLGLDTNVLIYAWLEAHSDKGRMAGRILASDPRAVLPVQVAAETLAVTRRKRPEMEHEIRTRVFELMDAHRAVDTSFEVLTHAVELSRRHGHQIYDAVIVAACARAGAKLLLSEDMHDGQRVAGLRILNPFAPANQTEINALLA